jgi:glycosyltransferase involved in cell wall biosynthesis
MYCIILSDTASFPWGMAASTRVRNIAKALIDQGVTVNYLGLRGANTKYEKHKRKSGQSDQINYSFPGGFPVRSQNWLVRRIDDLLGKWISYIKIKRLKKHGLLNAVIIYSRSYHTVMFWSGRLKKLDVKVILELCEWPLAKNYSSEKQKINAWKFCNQAILTVDAILPISSYIEKEVNEIVNKTGKTIPTFRIPILTDFKLTSDPKFHKEIEDKYMLYAGSAEYLDIAYFIIDVMQELKNRNCKIKLKFTGRIEQGLKDRLINHINKKNVSDCIEFTGFLEENKLYSQMMKAVCLIAPLPENEQSKARFPTKIGYYLSSGRPVLTNAVGSVNEYLTDNVNAYIAERFEVMSIAKKVIEIIDDPIGADQVGQSGQQLAFEKFYYPNACKGLSDFLLTFGS